MIKHLFNCYSISSASDICLEYIEGNRNPKENMEHIRRIANAMRKHKHIPLIIVANFNGHKYIVDGQHRYEAANLLWENDEEYELGIEEYDFAIEDSGGTGVLGLENAVFTLPMCKYCRPLC